MGICNSAKKTRVPTQLIPQSTTNSQSKVIEISPEQDKKRNLKARNSVISVTSQKSKKKDIENEIDVIRKQNSSRTITFSKNKMRESITNFINTINQDTIKNSNISNYEKFKKLKDREGVKIFKAKSKITGKNVHIKQLTVNSLDKNFILETKNQEFLKSLDHPNIVNYVENFIFKDELYIVNEFMPKGSLLEYIKSDYKFTELHATVIIYQILSAICYLNKKNIMHRNLKPENIFVEKFLIDEQFFFVKMSDFKRAKIYKKGLNENELVGTGIYLSPEVITSSYNEKCDVWTCGIIFYLLLCQRTPFKGKTEDETFNNILNKEVNFQGTKISRDCKSFIRKMLEKDVEKRPTVEELLNNDYLKNLNLGAYFDVGMTENQMILQNLTINPFNLCERILTKFVKEIQMSDQVFYRKMIFMKIGNKSERIFLKDLIEYIKKLNLKDNALIVMREKLEDLLRIEGFKTNGFSVNDFIYHTLNKQMIMDNIEILYYLIKDEFSSFTIEDLSDIFIHLTVDIKQKMSELNEQKNFGQIDVNKLKLILDVLLN